VFKVIFIIAVVLVVPGFFLFSWLMSRRHARRNAAREQPRENSDGELRSKIRSER
jgi:hypothetical protein